MSAAAHECKEEVVLTNGLSQLLLIALGHTTGSPHLTGRNTTAQEDEGIFVKSHSYLREESALEPRLLTPVVLLGRERS